MFLLALIVEFILIVGLAAFLITVLMGLFLLAVTLLVFAVYLPALIYNVVTKGPAGAVKAIKNSWVSRGIDRLWAKLSRKPMLAPVNPLEWEKGAEGLLTMQFQDGSSLQATLTMDGRAEFKAPGASQHLPGARSFSGEWDFDRMGEGGVVLRLKTWAEALTLRLDTSTGQLKGDRTVSGALYRLTPQPSEAERLFLRPAD